MNVPVDRSRAAKQAVIDQFEAALMADSEPRIEDYVTSKGKDNGNLLLDLVCIDMRWRRRRGLAIRVEDYLERWPCLGESETQLLRMITAEYDLRAGHDGAASLFEYQRRFPHVAEALSVNLLDRAAPLPTLRVGCPYCQEPIAPGRAESEKKRAEQSFATARETVHRLLTVAPNHELIRKAGMEPLKIDLQELGLRHYQRLQKLRPNDIGITRDLGYAHFFLAMTLEDVGRRAEAVDQYDQATAIMEKLVTDDSDRANQHRRNLAACYGNQANLLVEMGNRRKGIEAYQRVCQMQQSLGEANPRDGVNQMQLAVTHMNLGMLQVEDGDTESALVSAREACTRLTSLHKKVQDNSQVTYSLAKARLFLGRVWCQEGNREQAARNLDQAAELWEALLRQGPENAEIRCELGTTWYEKAVLYRTEGDMPRAVEAMEMALQRHEETVAAAPQVVRYRAQLSGDHEVLGIFRLDAERFTEARQHFEQMRRLWPTDPQWLYRSASALALGAHKIDLLGEHATAEQAALRCQLAHDAIEWLREAIEAGFRDVAAMEDSPRLVALRDLPDFLKLTAGLKNEQP